MYVILHLYVCIHIILKFICTTCSVYILFIHMFSGLAIWYYIISWCALAWRRLFLSLPEFLVCSRVGLRSHERSCIRVSKSIVVLVQLLSRQLYWWGRSFWHPFKTQYYSRLPVLWLSYNPSAPLLQCFPSLRLKKLCCRYISWDGLHIYICIGSNVI